jgi:hypothetical protein
LSHTSAPGGSEVIVIVRCTQPGKKFTTEAQMAKRSDEATKRRSDEGVLVTKSRSDEVTK